MSEPLTTDAASARSPSVTVIMPVRNEAAFIDRSLASVLHQTYPSEDLEILVVDGMSDDGTRQAVQRLADRATAPRIILLDNPAGIVPTAFNIGLRNARGEIIVRVDGHCVLAPDYVDRCVALLRETGADNVGGRQNAVGHGLVDDAVARATGSRFGVGNARFHYAEHPGWTDTVYLGAWRRDVFDRIGGFDEDLVRNQDDEFNFRLRQEGGRIWLDPSIRSTYYSRPTLAKLWNQYFQYGFYKVLVIQKRGAVPSWRHVVPGVFVLLLIVSAITAVVTGTAFWASTVWAPYLLANIMASLWVARGRWRVLPVLPVVFFTLHAAYGTGFLWGAWQWRNRFRIASGRHEDI